MKQMDIRTLGKKEIGIECASQRTNTFFTDHHRLNMVRVNVSRESGFLAPCFIETCHSFSFDLLICIASVPKSVLLN